jgi:hypothetical protein
MGNINRTLSDTSQKDMIQNYLKELIAIPASDILVRCSNESSKVVPIPFNLTTEFKLDVTPRFKRIWKQSTELFKEAAIETLCVSFGGISLDNNSESTTPLFLIKASCSFVEQKTVVKITIDPTTVILNPFLVQKWTEDKKEIRIDETLTWEDNYLQVINQVRSHYPDAVISDCSFIGNFHYHRFALLREMELLVDLPLNNVLGTLLGEASIEEKSTIKLTEQQISSLDADQAKIVHALSESNCVVEGPPGAGKSDLITNLSAKLMFGQHHHLILSEKKSALEVLLRKLKEFQLDHFVGSFLEDDSPIGFLKKTMATWNKLEQINTANSTKNLLLSKQKKANLQQLLDKLNSPNLIGETTYASFIELVGDYSLDKVPFEVNVPSIETWNQEKSFVMSIFKNLISKRIFSVFQHAFFKQSYPTNKLVDYTNKLKKIHQVYSINTLEDLFSFKRFFSLIQLFNNESNKSYYDLYHNEKLKRKFLKLSKQFLAVDAKFNSLQLLEKNWINIPSDEVFFTIVERSNATSLLSRFSIKRTLKKWLVEPTINFVDFKMKWEEYILCRTERNRLISELHLLGIHYPTTEIYSILPMLERWEQSSSSDLKTVASWKPEIREQMIELGPIVNECIGWFSKNLILSNDSNYWEVLALFFEHLEKLESVSGQVAQLSPSVFSLLQKYASVDEIELVVLKSHWVKLGALFPGLMEYKPQNLVKEIEAIIKEEATEFSIFSSQIWEQQRTVFLNYQRLLVTSSAKLSEEDKKLKQLLKQGKRILVKQAGKSRNVMSVRDLIASEAWIWIKLLHPCWVLTPLQLAKFFPMETNLFEALIIDEASQLPLTHSFGALQRSKRALICGDSQQMAPTVYFSSQSEQIDVLYHASFYWKKLYLKHHYRSQHTQLIAFSNRYFYNDELVTYPTSNLESPPLVLHYLEHGRFLNRINEIEARAVVKAVENQLNSSHSIGIVAFSQEQIDCIWKLFSVSTQNRLRSQWENGVGFMKPLEKVQGEECDVLYISMGYAKNEQGNFQLKMGPLNRRYGHRRLNVLFTRAKHHLHFFTSVRSSDFLNTENESINLLKRYLEWLESSPTIPNLVFPFQLNPSIQGNAISLRHVHTSIPSATELVTFYRVLKSRDWEINFC